MPIISANRQHKNGFPIVATNGKKFCKQIIRFKQSKTNYTIENRLLRLPPTIDAYLVFDDAFRLPLFSGMVFLSLTTLTRWCACFCIELFALGPTK